LFVPRQRRGITKSKSETVNVWIRTTGGVILARYDSAHRGHPHNARL
jgi:hypothetical protein